MGKRGSPCLRGLFPGCVSGAPELWVLRSLSLHQEEDIMYYDAKADAELVSASLPKLPEPHPRFWSSVVSGVKRMSRLSTQHSEINTSRAVSLWPRVDWASQHCVAGKIPSWAGWQGLQPPPTGHFRPPCGERLNAMRVGRVGQCREHGWRWLAHTQVPLQAREVSLPCHEAS